MTDRTVTVRRVPADDELTEQPEHCAMDPQTLAAVGAATGRQVRITLPDGARALYTVSRAQDETPDDVVRMGLRARRRFGTDRLSGAVVSAQILRSDLADATAEEAGELVERLDDGGGRALIVIAPHGGDIEPHTDEQAERVAARLAGQRISRWLCRGWRRTGAADAYHITSGDLSASSFPLLGTVIDRGFAHAVSFHGFAPGDDQPDVLVGGAAGEDLRQLFVEAIARATAGTGLTVRSARPRERFGGDDAGNVVNRLTGRGATGVQVEQSARARDARWGTIAESVADVYDLLLRAPARTDGRGHAAGRPSRPAVRTYPARGPGAPEG